MKLSKNSRMFITIMNDHILIIITKLLLRHVMSRKPCKQKIRSGCYKKAWPQQSQQSQQLRTFTCSALTVWLVSERQKMQYFLKITKISRHLPMTTRWEKCCILRPIIIIVPENFRNIHDHVSFQELSN